MRSHALKGLSIFAALLLLGACAQRAGRAIPSTVADRDALFMRDASAGSISEIRLSQLAMQNAASPNVKRFAQAMLDDHIVSDQQLRVLADRKSVDLPLAPDPAHEGVVVRLSRVQGPEFDRQYMAEMVKSHEKTLSEFRNEAATTRDDDVKAYAERNLPVLHQHLDHARMLSDMTQP